MAERLTKKKRKGLIAQRLLDPATTTSQLISLTKLYDARKKKARPPKDKSTPVPDESSMIFGRPRTYFSELDLKVFEIERERATARGQEPPAKPSIFTRPMEALLKPVDPDVECANKAATDPLFIKELLRQIEARERQKPLDEPQEGIPRHLRADIN